MSKRCDTDDTLGSRIRDARKRRGLTQPALAAAAGLDRSHLSHIENGKRENVSLGLLRDIARALGVAPIDLMPSMDASVAKTKQ